MKPATVQAIPLKPGRVCKAAHLVLASETAMVSVSIPVLMEFALNSNLNPLIILG